MRSRDHINHFCFVKELFGQRRHRRGNQSSRVLLTTTSTSVILGVFRLLLYIVTFRPLARWILLCFKREFRDSETLRIWESCWSAYGTDRFHLFVALSVLYTYRPLAAECGDGGGDDLLLHFASLTMHMDVDIVLTKVTPEYPFIRCTFCSLSIGPKSFPRGLEINSPQSTTCRFHVNFTLISILLIYIFYVEHLFGLITIF